MTHDYVWEKLTQAVLCLLAGGTHAARLEGAGLSLMGLRREEFIDEDEYVRWSAIMERFTAREEVATLTEGSIAAGVRTMSDDQARSLVREIVHLHERHIESLAKKQPLRCAECGRWVDGHSEVEERWLVFSDGAGKLDMFCPACSGREF